MNLTNPTEVANEIKNELEKAWETVARSAKDERQMNTWRKSWNREISRLLALAGDIVEGRGSIKFGDPYHDIWFRFFVELREICSTPNGNPYLGEGSRIFPILSQWLKRYHQNAPLPEGWRCLSLVLTGLSRDF